VKNQAKQPLMESSTEYLKDFDRYATPGFQATRGGCREKKKQGVWVMKHRSSGLTANRGARGGQRCCRQKMQFDPLCGADEEKKRPREP